MGQIKFVSSLLLTAVFSVAIVMFAIGFANDNSTAFSIEDQEGFNNSANNIKGNLSGYKTTVVNNSKSAFEVTIETGETSTSGTPLRMGITEARTSTETALRQGWKVIFGDDSQFGFIITAFITFILFVGVALWWKTWAGRNPE